VQQAPWRVRPLSTAIVYWWLNFVFSDDMLNAIFTFIHSGQTPMDADFNLLDTARKVEFYGIHLFPAQVSELDDNLRGPAVL